MKPITGIIFLLNFLGSCQKETDCTLGQKELVNYVLSIDNSRDEYGVRNEFSQFEVILKIKSGDLITFPIDYLDGLHQSKEYKSLSYSKFICLLINEELKPYEKMIPKLPDIYSLDPDEETLSVLNNLGLDTVFKKYNFSKDKDGFDYTDKNEDISSLVYYLYKNGYLFVFSSIEDKVAFIKPEQISDYK